MNDIVALESKVVETVVSPLSNFVTQVVVVHEPIISGAQGDIAVLDSKVVETVLYPFTNSITQSVIVHEPIISGPQGPQGISSEDMEVYSKRIDFINDNLLYRGEATPGSTESASVWRIRQISISSVDSDIVEKWASGNAAFINSWSDRLSLSYI